jgi:hypothetical protein
MKTKQRSKWCSHEPGNSWSPQSLEETWTYWLPALWEGVQPADTLTLDAWPPDVWGSWFCCLNHPVCLLVKAATKHEYSHHDSFLLISTNEATWANVDFPKVLTPQFPYQARWWCGHHCGVRTTHAAVRGPLSLFAFQVESQKAGDSEISNVCAY